MVDRVVVVDGRPALLFPSAPRKVAGSTFHDGDSALLVTSGQAGDKFAPVRCDAGQSHTQLHRRSLFGDKFVLSEQFPKV